MLFYCDEGTLITKKFGRKNNSDKRVSENLTVQNFRRPKFFTSEIFHVQNFSRALSQRE